MGKQALRYFIIIMRIQLFMRPVILTYPIYSIFQNVSLFTNDFVFKVFGINTIWNFCMEKLCFWYWQHNQFISELLVELICIQFMHECCIFVSISCYWNVWTNSTYVQRLLFCTKVGLYGSVIPDLMKEHFQTLT